LEETRREMNEGRLPAGTKFFQADISRPEALLASLQREGIDPGGAVMIVGNGFQEVRDQTDEEMVETIRKYREAGIIVVFTEESDLTDAQIRAAGWNTYHAGFRYVHQISGQVLRGPWPMNPSMGRLSWTEVFEKAGYRIELCHGTRPIFPYDA